MTKADRDRLDEMLRNAERTRELALKGAAELAARGGPNADLWTGEWAPDPRPFGAMSDRERLREMRKNAERTRQFALRGLAELERRNEQSA
jgi:hypothetical protein